MSKMDAAYGEQVFDHPLQEDEQDTSKKITTFEGKSFRETGFTGGLFSCGDPFHGMADHEQRAEDRGVRDKRVVKKRCDQISLQKGMYGAGAAAARTIQSRYSVEQAGGDDSGQIKVETAGVDEEKECKKQECKNKTEDVECFFDGSFSKRFHGGLLSGVPVFLQKYPCNSSFGFLSRIVPQIRNIYNESYCRCGTK